jgi:hypothetical protein
MRITIDVHLRINGTRTLKSSYFDVYKEELIPNIAYDWIKQIRFETGYYGKDSIIERVVFNSDQDITLLVKRIDEAPIPDLDFLW